LQQLAGGGGRHKHTPEQWRGKRIDYRQYCGLDTQEGEQRRGREELPEGDAPKGERAAEEDDRDHV
jgi:hypothetical protein